MPTHARQRARELTIPAPRDRRSSDDPNVIRIHLSRKKLGSLAGITLALDWLVGAVWVYILDFKLDRERGIEFSHWDLRGYGSISVLLLAMPLLAFVWARWRKTKRRWARWVRWTIFAVHVPLVVWAMHMVVTYSD